MKAGTWRNALAALLVGAATIAVFMPATRGAFVWDDGGLITRHPEWLDEWSDAAAAFTRPVTAGEGVAYYRPILSVTLVADARLGDAAPTQFHRTNVLLHGLNAALVYLLLALYTGSVPASLLGALLFALHPIQCQAVALILGRNDELLVPPVVGMLIADELGRRSGRRLAAGCVVLLCYAATLWTKETGVVVPAVLLLNDVLWHRPDRETVRRRIPLFAALAGVAFAYFWTRYRVLGSVVESGAYGSASVADRLVSAMAILGYYLRHLVLPWGFAPTPFHSGLVDPARPEIWLATLACAGFLVLIAVAAVRAPRLAYGLLFVLIGLIPVLGIAALMKVPILEHRTYMPMIGVAFVGATAATRFTSATARTAMAGVLALMAALTFTRLPRYADAASLWKFAVEAAPSSAYARNNYAGVLMDAGRTADAVPELREALRLDPGYIRARFNLAGCLESLGDRPQAMRELETILATQPDEPSVLNRLGLMRSRVGDLDGAETALAKAAARSPENATIAKNLADLLERRGEWAAAVEPRRRVTTLDPQNGTAWWALGRALANADRAGEAIPALEQALALGIDGGPLRSDLAHMLFRAGRWPDAAAQAKRARELGVADPELIRALTDAGVMD